jgi:predicted nucleotidyltransferase component of viral defense system
MEGALMLSRAELQRLAHRERVALGVLEKDYVLTEVLKALSQLQALRESFVFKGGTALRKVYFPHWRYSEDMDFTVKFDIPKEELGQNLDGLYHQVEQATQIRLTTRMLHKTNGYARIRTQFLGPLAHPAMIYMDLSFDEPLCLEPQLRKVLTAPFPDDERTVQVYPLEELMAEKMRSLIERGKSRDYYDVWRLLKEQRSQMNLELLGMVLEKKLRHKGLRLRTTADFLPENPAGIKRYWEKDLSQQIATLLPLEDVLNELKQMLDSYVSPYLPLHSGEPR